MPLKKYNMLIIFCLSLWIILPVQADIAVSLSAPQWRFLLDNHAWSEAEAKPRASENSFVRSLQPLLGAQDNEAILAAFENRDMKQDSAALRLLRGQVLLSLKHYKDAEKALRSALVLMPKLALAHRSLSMVYMLNKDYGAARVHLTQTIELGRADAQVYGQLAFVNLQLNQAASSLAGYQYALFLEPNNDQWQKGMLYALIQTQAFDQAQALLEELILHEPKSVDLWLQRGQIALNQSRTQQAIASLERAIALRSEGANNDDSTGFWAENIATTAQLHIQDGSPKRAVDLLAGQASTLIMAGKIEVLHQVASWLAYQQNWQELARLMHSLESKNLKFPSTYRAHFDVYRAQVALSNKSPSKKQQHEAERYLRRAIAIDPANGEALLSLATVLNKQSRREQALLYFTRAEALSDFEERALLGRAQLEIDRQNYDQALRALRRVVKINPGRSDLLANIRSLETLILTQA